MVTRVPPGGAGTCCLHAMWYAMVLSRSSPATNDDASRLPSFSARHDGDTRPMTRSEHDPLSIYSPSSLHVSTPPIHDRVFRQSRRLATAAHPHPVLAHAGHTYVTSADVATLLAPSLPYARSVLPYARSVYATLTALSHLTCRRAARGAHRRESDSRDVVPREVDATA